MRHLIFESEFLNSAGRVSAAHNAGGFPCRYGLGYFPAAPSKGFPFKNAHGSIPQNGFCASQFLFEKLNRFRTNVQPHPPGFNRGDNLGLSVFLESISGDMIHGQYDSNVHLPGFFKNFLGNGETRLIEFGIAYRLSLDLEKSVSHSAAYQQSVNFG